MDKYLKVLSSLLEMVKSDDKNEDYKQVLEVINTSTTGKDNGLSDLTENELKQLFDNVIKTIKDGDLDISVPDIDLAEVNGSEAKTEASAEDKLTKTEKKLETAKIMLKELDSKLAKYEALNHDELIATVAKYEALGDYTKLAELKKKMEEDEEGEGLHDDVDKLNPNSNIPAITIDKTSTDKGTPTTIDPSGSDSKNESKTDMNKKTNKPKSEDGVVEKSLDEMTTDELKVALKSYQDLGTIEDIEELMEKSNNLLTTQAETTEKVESLKVELGKYEAIGTIDEINKVVEDYAQHKTKAESARLAGLFGLSEDKVLAVIEKTESIAAAEDLLALLHDKVESKSDATKDKGESVVVVDTTTKSKDESSSIESLNDLRRICDSL